MIQPCRSFCLSVCLGDRTSHDPRSLQTQCVSCFATYHCNKGHAMQCSLGRKELIFFSLHSILKASQDRNLKQEASRAELKQRSWRNTAHWLALQAQDGLLWSGTAHAALSLPPQSSVSEKRGPTLACLQDRLYEGFFSIEVPSSQLILTSTLCNHKDDLGMYCDVLFMPCRDQPEAKTKDCCRSCSKLALEALKKKKRQREEGLCCWCTRSLNLSLFQCGSLGSPEFKPKHAFEYSHLCVPH